MRAAVAGGAFTPQDLDVLERLRRLRAYQPDQPNLLESAGEAWTLGGEPGEYTTGNMLRNTATGAVEMGAGLAGLIAQQATQTPIQNTIDQVRSAPQMLEGLLQDYGSRYSGDVLQKTFDNPFPYVLDAASIAEAPSLARAAIPKSGAPSFSLSKLAKGQMPDDFAQWARRMEAESLIEDAAYPNELAELELEMYGEQIGPARGSLYEGAGRRTLDDMAWESELAKAPRRTFREWREQFGDPAYYMGYAERDPKAGVYRDFGGNPVGRIPGLGERLGNYFTDKIIGAGDSRRLGSAIQGEDLLRNALDEPRTFGPQDLQGFGAEDAMNRVYRQFGVNSSDELYELFQRGEINQGDILDAMNRGAGHELPFSQGDLERGDLGIDESRWTPPPNDEPYRSLMDELRAEFGEPSSPTQPPKYEGSMQGDIDEVLDRIHRGDWENVESTDLRTGETTSYQNPVRRRRFAKPTIQDVSMWSEGWPTLPGEPPPIAYLGELDKRAMQFGGPDLADIFMSDLPGAKNLAPSQMFEGHRQMTPQTLREILEFFGDVEGRDVYPGQPTFDPNQPYGIWPDQPQEFPRTEIPEDFIINFEDNPGMTWGPEGSGGSGNVPNTRPTLDEGYEIIDGEDGNFWLTDPTGQVTNHGSYDAAYRNYQLIKRLLNGEGWPE